MNSELRKYFAEIGRKGGQAGKGKSSEKCRKAAQARWAAVKKAKELEANGTSSNQDTDCES